MFYEWAQKQLKENDNWIVFSVETDCNRITWRAKDLAGNNLFGNWSGECRSLFTHDDTINYVVNNLESGNAKQSDKLEWTWNGHKRYWTSVVYCSSIVAFEYNGKTYKCGYKMTGYTYSYYYNKPGNINKIFLLGKKV